MSIIIYTIFQTQSCKVTKIYCYFSKNSAEMDEARDIVQLALSFMVGIFLISCFPLGINHLYITASVAMTILSLTLMLMLSQISRDRKISIWEVVGVGIITGIFVRASASINSLTTDTYSPITNLALQLGERMQSCIDSIEFRSESTNALIKALLTGSRSDIPKDITDAFRASGASHILALSGLHLGIIYLIISKATSILGEHPKARMARSFLCIIICTIYSLATGAGASITRALIFIIIRETGKILHRPVDLKTTLASCLIIHLIFSPEDISNVGFQLSYAAIAGIAWIYPWIEGLWPSDGSKSIMKRVWESAAISISCQITTGPLAWYYFHTFPQYFLLTNLIALPLTSLIIPCALLTTALNGWGVCPQFMIEFTELLVKGLIHSLSIIASM